LQRGHSIEAEELVSSYPMFYLGTAVGAPKSGDAMCFIRE